MQHIHSSSILLLPLIVTFMGKKHTVEIVGKVIPFCKYFTCKIPGADMLILEATRANRSQSYSWSARQQHQFSYLVPFIGKEIEKHLK